MVFLGNKRKVYLTTAQAAAAAASDWLQGETSHSLSLNANLVEVTDKSSEYQEYVPGIKGGTLSVTVNADPADTKQTSLLTAILAGTRVFVFVGEIGGTGHRFAAYVSSVSEQCDNAAVCTRTFELTIDGEITAVSAA